MAESGQIQVLIAEDDYLVTQLIKNFLAEIGYQVIAEVTNGVDAVEKTCTLQPDVVVMDLDMPELDGLEATRQLFHRCPTPVVILTAYDTMDLVKQAGEAGAGAYLTKPPSSYELERAIVMARARFNDMVKLHQLNAQLQARNEEIDTFAHTVAHQLKNSSSLVTTFGNILKSSLELPEAMQLYLDGIVQTGQKMNNVISELQLLAGIRTGSVEPTPLNMAEIVAEARQRLFYTIEEHQAQIIAPTDWPVALGYGPWIEEVWVNYIGNAVKYGGDSPQVELGATLQTDQFVRFWVQDKGPGLPLEKQAQIFRPFTRHDQIKIEGHGLGLAIVRHIVERLGGQVGLESEGVPGRGSVFTFTLPASRL